MEWGDKMKTNNNSDTFGSRLKQLRIEKGLTLEELGNILSVTKATVSKYERNALEVNYTTAKTLSEHFNVTLDYLMCSNNDKADTEEAIHIKRLIQEYRDLVKQLEISEIEALIDMKGRGLSIVEVNKSLKKLLSSKI
jgi:transcriptional regulator with XRE-family HTH domain